MTVKHCNKPAVKAYKLGQIIFIDVFCLCQHIGYYAWSGFPR